MTKKWTQSYIEQTLGREIASILGMEEGEFQPSTTLISLGIDSINFVEIMIFVENEFGIKLIDSGMSREALHDIASLSAHIVSILQDRESSSAG